MGQADLPNIKLKIGDFFLCHFSTDIYKIEVRDHTLITLALCANVIKVWPLTVALSLVRNQPGGANPTQLHTRGSNGVQHGVNWGPIGVQHEFQHGVQH